MMVAVFAFARKLQLRALMILSALALAACSTMPSVGGGPQVNTSRAVPVALLLPQSFGAEGAALSASLENAARLAIADLNGVNVALSVYDSGGTAAGGAAAAEAAVRDGNKIILGPVFADAAAGAGQGARNINVLAFSNNPSVAGGNVFILGSTFDNTAQRLAGYAARQGVRDIVVVNAQSAAEEQGRAAVQRALAANGMRLAGSVPFEASQNGVINAVPEIASQVRANGANGIFLTSGNDGAVPFLAELLPENGIDPAEVQLIGLQRLDRPATALALSGLQGAWFAVPDPGLVAQFSARYQAAYGSLPHPLAALAYDGIAAVGALVATGDSGALTATSLTRPSGFSGANGVFRLRPNGTNERGLAVATIQNQQVTYLDPAPRSFGGAGF